MYTSGWGSGHATRASNGTKMAARGFQRPDAGRRSVTNIGKKGHDCDLGNRICHVIRTAHFRRFLHNPFAMVTSVLASAMTTALRGFPSLRRRSAKDHGLGS